MDPDTEEAALAHQQELENEELTTKTGEHYEYCDADIG